MSQLLNPFEKYLEELPGGVIVLDARQTIIYANHQAETWLDTTLIGQPWRHVKNLCKAIKREKDLVCLPDGRAVKLASNVLAQFAGQVILLQELKPVADLSYQQALEDLWAYLVLRLKDHFNADWRRRVMKKLEMTQALIKQGLQSIKHHMACQIQALQRKLPEVLALCQSQHRQTNLAELVTRSARQLQTEIKSQGARFIMCNQAKGAECQKAEPISSLIQNFVRLALIAQKQPELICWLWQERSHFVVLLGAKSQVLPQGDSRIEHVLEEGLNDLRKAACDSGTLTIQNFAENQMCMTFHLPKPSSARLNSDRTIN